MTSGEKGAMERVIAGGSPNDGDPRQHPQLGEMDHGTWSCASPTAWSLSVSFALSQEARQLCSHVQVHSNF